MYLNKEEQKSHTNNVNKQAIVYIEAWEYAKDNFIKIFICITNIKINFKNICVKIK